MASSPKALSNSTMSSNYKSFTIKVPTFSRTKQDVLPTHVEASEEGATSGHEAESSKVEANDTKKDAKDAKDDNHDDDNDNTNNDRVEKNEKKTGKKNIKKEKRQSKPAAKKEENSEAAKKETEKNDEAGEKTETADGNENSAAPEAPVPSHAKAKLSMFRLPKFRTIVAKPRAVDPGSAGAAGASGPVGSVAAAGNEGGNDNNNVRLVVEDDDDGAHGEGAGDESVQAPVTKKTAKKFKMPHLKSPKLAKMPKMPGAPRLKGRTWVDPWANDGKDRSRFPVQPMSIHFLRIAEIIVAFIVIVLTAYAAATIGGQVGLVLLEVYSRSNLAVYINQGEGFALSWFTFIWTVVYFVWLHLVLWRYPAYYHPYVHLGIETLATIFWLATFATLAGEATLIRDVNADIYKPMPGSYRTALQCVKAAAGVAAAVWLLFCASLVVLVRGIIIQRRPAQTADPERGEAGEAADTNKAENSALEAPGGYCATQ